MYPSTPKRLRVLAALVAALSLFTLAMPVAAAPKGVRAILTVDPAIEAVSLGRIGAFEVFVKNDGPGTFTHAVLAAEVSRGTILSVTVLDGAAVCSAPVGAKVSCDFDKLDAQEEATLLVRVQAPSTGGQAITLNATLQVDAAGENPNAESKDTFRDSDTLPVRTDGEFFGNWQSAHANTLSFSTAAVGGNNGQSTKVDVPSAEDEYPWTIEETTGAIVCTNGPTITGFGKAFEVHVNNGDPVTPHVTITVTYDKNTSSGKAENNTTVVHQLDNGTCEFPPRGCTANPGFCFDVTVTGSGQNRQLVIVMQLPTNGRGRGV